MSELRDPVLEAWYRAGAGEEPPVALDAAVLAAAHLAVSAKPQSLVAKTRQTWFWPVAAAAVLVLSVSIVRLTPTEEVLPAILESAPVAPGRVETGDAPPPTADAASAAVKRKAREEIPPPGESPARVPERAQLAAAPRPEASPAKRSLVIPPQAEAPRAPAGALAETRPAPAAGAGLAKTAPAAALPLESRLTAQPGRGREQEGKMAQTQERAEVAAELSYAPSAPSPKPLA
ncbi:MAG: hypothetical protein F9K47_09640, partial [Burkholderiales bacterium]